MKNLIKKNPLLRSIAQRVYFTFVAPFRSFPGSEDYWKRRYSAGGNSGAGSYSKLAEFKAKILNEFVKQHGISTVIEFGCGDGNQLRLAQYPHYVGYDVSPEAISLCEHIFAADDTKTFKLMESYGEDKAELSLSLDVIYHLVEDDVFDRYMTSLFESSSGYVIIYSSNTNRQSKLQAAHVRHREFSSWIESNKPEWHLVDHIANPYPYQGDDEEGSFADFYVYALVDTDSG